MILNHSPTELTTSATDALLALECLFILAWLWRAPQGDRRRAALWSCAFGLLASASVLGTIVHGFDLATSTREALWKPLYLSLGILMALFVVGALYDWRGRTMARRAAPWAVGAGAAFFAVTQLGSGDFIVFDVYAAAAQLCALGIYVFLAATRGLRGAWVIAMAIVLNLAAAGVQATHASATIVFPLDHNGIFHFVQMAGAAALGLGVRLGLRPEAQQPCRGSDRQERSARSSEATLQAMK